MSASRIAATVPPMNVARPPARDAPPRTAAVMLFSAKVEPTCALPIGDRAMTKNDGHGREHRRQEQSPDPEPVGPDPAAFGRPFVEPHRPQLQTRSGGMEPDVRERRPGEDDDERHGDRSDARGEHRHQVGADDPLGRRSQGERDPVQDAQRGQGGDDRGDLEPSDQAGVDEAEGDAAQEDDADPEQDLGRRRPRRRSGRRR